MKQLDHLKKTKIFATGCDPRDARYGFIMLHGRGSDVGDMRSILPMLQSRDIYVIMPEAPIEIMPGRYAWYPFFWNENLEVNMKHLKYAFEILDDCVDEMIKVGIGLDKIVFVGHSQGANVIMEYFGQNPRHYKSIISMRGCFLGNYGDERTFSEKVGETLVVINAGRRDPYIPTKKIDQTANTLERLGARVEKRQYETGHGISRAELLDLKKLLRNDFVFPEDAEGIQE